MASTGCRSDDTGDCGVLSRSPLLNLRLVRLRRFNPLRCRWQLKHGGLLSLLKQIQKNDLAIREFQGVMVCRGMP